MVLQVYKNIIIIGYHIDPHYHHDQYCCLVLLHDSCYNFYNYYYCLLPLFILDRRTIIARFPAEIDNLHSPLKNEVALPSWN